MTVLLKGGYCRGACVVESEHGGQSAGMALMVFKIRVPSPYLKTKVKTPKKDSTVFRLLLFAKVEAMPCGQVWCGSI